MADLIDRNALEKSIRNYADRKHCNGQTELANGILKALSMVEAAPAVDAVPVVRCRECKYYNQFLILRECTKEYSLCNVSPDDYCSYGERKEDG